MDRSQVMKTSHRPGWTWQRLGLRMTGAGLLIATGAIHLDLYVTGYRTIPTIGWLFLLQVIAALVLGAAVLVLGHRPPPPRRRPAPPPRLCGRPPAPPAGAGQVLKTTKIGGVTVVTSANGLTLYWFVPDTATASKCYGACAQYWPPVFGNPKAGPGVTGTLGTIKRSDGTTQATYDGHPLYTYIGDTGAGQAHGNNINLNGGVWHEVLVSG